jgi:hypothetical protein
VSLVYLGLEARVDLFRAKASIFDLTLGYGLDTDLGYKDDKISAHLFGLGGTLGMGKISISAYGSSVRFSLRSLRSRQDLLVLV